MVNYDEARAFIKNRFDDSLEPESQWWHQENGEKFLFLFDNLYDLFISAGWDEGWAANNAYDILEKAFYAAADEYGA